MTGVAEALANGASGRFSVTAANLNPAHRYLVRAVYRGGLGTCANCTSFTEDRTSEVFWGVTMHTEEFTVYGCARGEGTITAGLWRVIDGEAQHLPFAISESVSVTVD